MNGGGLGFWVALGHLALRPKAEGAGEAKEGDLTAGDLARPLGSLTVGMKKFRRRMLITQLRKEALEQILTTPVRDVQLDNGQKFLLRASSWKKPCPVHSTPRAVN